jgi:hypothetical protein
MTKRMCSLAITLWFLAGSAAFAATRWVNDNDPNGGAYAPPGTSCNNPGYQSIQAAVDAAGSGDTISVCQGTYSEQVFVVGPGLNNLTLVSVVPFQATIKAPLVMDEPGDLVTIDNAHNVTLRDFVVTGPLPDILFCSLELRSGIRVKGGGSALIVGNRITEMRATNPALRGCQNGFGIAVGRRFDPLGPQVGSAAIVRNVLDRYQKGGIYVDNTGSRADIRDNVVQGEGPVNFIAQNGIQVSRDATAQVLHNSVRDHAYSLPAFTASGMILFGAGRIVVDRNQLNRNQDGVVLLTMVGVATISSNGIVGGGAAAAPNPFGDGIFADVDTAQNVIRGNFLRNNTEHDCHDDSVGLNNPPANVANFWINNNGVTENRPGLCRGDNDDEDDDDFDDDGQRNHVDDDDDNDGRRDSVDEDDDNDGQPDNEDEDDDNDNISDLVDSDARETQRSASGTVAGGQYEDRTMAVDAGTLALSGLVEAPNADLLRVAIYDPAGLLVGISQPALGRALITVPVALPGLYTFRVQNTGTEPIDYIVRLVTSKPWP